MGARTVVAPLIAGMVDVSPTILPPTYKSSGGRVGGLLIGSERLIPNAVEVGPQGTHSSRVDLIDTARSLGPTEDEPAIFEHAKVLGYRRPGDRELLGQFPHGPGVPSQQLEDRAPGRVTKQTQVRISVSVH